jgi:hypothetical protein
MSRAHRPAPLLLRLRGTTAGPALAALLLCARRNSAARRPFVAVAGAFKKADTENVLQQRLIVAIGSMALGVLGCGGSDVSDQEHARAIRAAKQSYVMAAARGEQLEVGPCIAEELAGMPRWVADIAHDPREDTDDEPENQCQRYRDGQASHFVELTPEGELIRAR